MIRQMKRKARNKTLNAEAPVLTMRQIRSRYKSEWVVVSEPETDRSLNVLRGRVLCHGTDRDKVYREMGRSKASHVAILYTGRLPKDVAIIL